MNKVVLAAIALCMTVAACKKDDDTPVQETKYTRKDTLTAGKWRITAFTFTANISGSDTTLNILASYDICQQDDYTIFRSDNHLINDEGATKCDTSGAQQTDGGMWNLAENDSKIILSGGALPGTFKISTLTSTTLQVKNDTTFLTLPVKSVITYTHVN